LGSDNQEIEIKKGNKEGRYQTQMESNDRAKKRELLK